jgi:hypothetical protein
MAKERKTAEQSADIIAGRLIFGEGFIKVMKDSVYGWRADAMVNSAQMVAIQTAVEIIVVDLRVHYDLLV